MAKCKDCGFLAMWDRYNRKFEESPELFRKDGKPQSQAGSDSMHQPTCFAQKANLADEIKKGSDGYTTVYREDLAILKVIELERNCNGYFEWMQGFSPKEHAEMLMNKEMLENQRRHANHSLWAAIATAAFTGLSVAIGAYITSNSAHVGAEATISAAKLQIEAQKELGKQIQPINITVQAPSLPTPDHSIPPKTTHDRKSRPPSQE